MEILQLLNKHSNIAGNSNLGKGWSMIEPDGLGNITQPSTIHGENARYFITRLWEEAKFETNEVQK
jgi:hypothetical protein